MSLLEGKELLLSVANGGSFEDASVPRPEGLEFLATLKKEARMLRWLACSLRPVRAEAGRTWPEATAFHYLWTPVEDWCLEAWVAHIRSRSPVHHLSCHFDGVLIDVDRARNVEPGTTFEQQSEKHIKEVTGYDVKVVKKVHDFFLPLLKAAATSSVASDMPTALREEGNCIPLALTRLTNTAAAIDKQLKNRDATNTTAAGRRVRCYRDWSCFERWVLVPSHGLDIKSGGKYPVSSETKGKRHCTALITDASGSCQVFDNDSCFTVDHGVVRACFLQALDRSHIVTFKLAPFGELETTPQDTAEDWSVRTSGWRRRRSARKRRRR
jgi:hypothetical protein